MDNIFPNFHYGPFGMHIEPAEIGEHLVPGLLPMLCDYQMLSLAVIFYFSFCLVYCWFRRKALPRASGESPWPVNIRLSGSGELNIFEIL